MVCTEQWRSFYLLFEFATPCASWCGLMPLHSLIRLHPASHEPLIADMSSLVEPRGIAERSFMVKKKKKKTRKRVDGLLAPFRPSDDHQEPPLIKSFFPSCVTRVFFDHVSPRPCQVPCRMEIAICVTCLFSVPLDTACHTVERPLHGKV